MCLGRDTQRCLSLRGRYDLALHALGSDNPFEVRAAALVVLPALIDQPEALGKALERFQALMKETRIQPPGVVR